jgi:hypothetical protein
MRGAGGAAACAVFTTTNDPAARRKDQDESKAKETRHIRTGTYHASGANR